MLYTRNIQIYLILFLLAILSILISLDLYVFFTDNQNVDTKLVVLSEKPTIKVITFNTQKGSPGGNCKEDDKNDKVNAMKSKIEGLANYVITLKADVLLLQEMAERCELKEVEMLSESLKIKGYPMEYFAQDEWMNNAIFSRFSLKKSEGKLLEIPARKVVMVPVDTPIGVINFYSTHIRHAQPDKCPGFEQLHNYFKADPNPLRILGADFNLTITSTQNNFECPENVRQAFITENNLVGNIIDFTVIPKQSNLKVESFYVDPNSPPSDHGAIVANIGLVNYPVLPTVVPSVSSAPTVLPTIVPSLFPSPTTQPSISPVPLVQGYAIDLDENGSVGIEDFLVFVQYYKASNCMIDYNRNNNCKDIEDFQIFVDEYKKDI